MRILDDEAFNTLMKAYNEVWEQPRDWDNPKEPGKVLPIDEKTVVKVRNLAMKAALKTIGIEVQH